MAYPYPLPGVRSAAARADRMTRALASPLGSLCLAIGLCLTVGCAVETRGLALAAALAVVAVVGIVYPHVAVRAVDASLRMAAERLREGDLMVAEVRLRNRWPIPLWGVGVRGVVAAGDAPEALVAVPAGGEVVVAVSGSAPRRGVFPVAPEVVCGFPFGLVHARRPLPAERPVLVRPRIFPAPPCPDRADDLRVDGAAPSRRPGHGGDIVGVRDFRRGDSLRGIHWGLSARHDRLVVTERHALRLPTATVVLDLRGAAAGDDGEREWAIRAAASLAAEWSAQGVEVRLWVRDRGERRHRGAPGLLQDALARLPWEAPSAAESCVADEPLPADAVVVAGVSARLPSSAPGVAAAGAETPERLRTAWG